jgi:hypothetical protein
MASNLDRFRADLDRLIFEGTTILLDLGIKAGAINAQEFSRQVEEGLERRKQASGDQAPKENVVPEGTRRLQTFDTDYQRWYSESLGVVRQLLPDRVSDFVSLYKASRPPREITYATYTLSDYAIGLMITRLGEPTFDIHKAAFSKFQQQLLILESARSRFDSSLFDLKAILRADLFDSELDAARELRKNGFGRAGGVIAGVVLERHLAQVASNHRIEVRKKHPNISEYNDALKGAGVFETATWRQIQRLSDLRNLCAHARGREPSEDEVEELLNGVEKIVKSVL